MINAFSLFTSKIRNNKNIIDFDTNFLINNIDKKLYEKIFDRENVDNVDILSILLFTKLSIIYDYDYDKIMIDLENIQ